MCSLTQYFIILPDIQGCKWEDPEGSRSEVPMSGLQQVLQRPWVRLQALASDSHEHLGRCSWRATPGNRSECIPCRSCPSSRTCDDLVIHLNLALWVWGAAVSAGEAYRWGGWWPFCVRSDEFGILWILSKIQCGLLAEIGDSINHLDISWCKVDVPWLLCCYLEGFPFIGTDPSARLERPALISHS